MSAEQPDYDFVLQPHRSLGPKGFLVVMAALAALSFTAGTLFMLQGAWPVFGFMGLDVLLVWFAFRQSFRSGRERERIVIQQGELTVMYRSPGGREQAWRFPAYWARVDLEPHPSGDNRLYIGSHGRRLRIGGFLSPDEREDLAGSLRDALQRARAADALQG